ncbi:MAG: lipid-A-disaccharide synthase [Selenomonadaceae bacterium]|nr:lipid-A-disaccharide synthase [Selenomonadaceae bacterium]
MDNLLLSLLTSENPLIKILTILGPVLGGLCGVFSAVRLVRRFLKARNRKKIAEESKTPEKIAEKAVETLRAALFENIHYVKKLTTVEDIIEGNVPLKKSRQFLKFNVGTTECTLTYKGKITCGCDLQQIRFVPSKNISGGVKVLLPHCKIIEPYVDTTTIKIHYEKKSNFFTPQITFEEQLSLINDDFEKRKQIKIDKGILTLAEKKVKDMLHKLSGNKKIPIEILFLDDVESLPQLPAQKSFKIMMSAGEVSGDIHGANIAREIKKISPDTEIFGMGGDEMQAAGVKIFRHFKDYNVMGVVEVVKNLRKILKLLDDLTEIARTEKPDLLVLIDYPDFNWRLAKRVKKFGVKILSYIPPSAWAWRKSRAEDCAKVADEFIAIFPFELPPYEDAGAKISFLGNPLVDAVKPSMSLADARNFFNVDESEHVILLMPGSRRQEINLILPEMLRAAEILSVQKPARFFLPVADNVDESEILRQIEAAKVDVTLTKKFRYDLMNIADAAIATSGTVVLEAALMNLPCVVLYKMARLNYFIGKILVDIENFSLPNILAGEKIQPELLQDEVKAEKIVEEILKLYRGESHREKVVADLQKACAKLGGKGAAERVALKILEVVSD